MNKEKKALFFTRVFRMIKKSGLFLIKVIYLAPFFVFGLWLLGLVYFPGFDLNASISLLRYRPEPEVLPVVIPKKEAVPRDHFHMIDAYVEKPAEPPPICVMCHGRYAHGKEKKVRALLNMHEGFISCSVCHVRKEGENIQNGPGFGNEISAFLWRIRATGEFKKAVDGEYGKYPATIFPVKVTEQGTRQILKPISESAARRFLEISPELNSEQFDAARAKLHEKISKEPVSCNDCHKKDGYLDFIQLGFSRQRVDHLISNEFVGMINKDQTIHLPSVIDFREAPQAE